LSTFLAEEGKESDLGLADERLAESFSKTKHEEALPWEMA
jgi:hypothetical protein